MIRKRKHYGDHNDNNDDYIWQLNFVVVLLNRLCLMAMNTKKTPGTSWDWSWLGKQEQLMIVVPPSLERDGFILKSSKSKRISPFVFSRLFLFQQHNQLTSEIFPTNGKTPVAGQPDSVLDKNQQRKIDSGFPSADSLSWSRLNRNACRTRQQHRGLVLIGTQLDIERTHANTQVQLWGTRTQFNESTNTTSWPPPRGLLVLFFRIKSIKFQ